MSTTIELLEEHRMFEGWQQRYRHFSSSLQSSTTFSIYLPPPRDDNPPAVVYWLSGLTCNDENFTTKAGAQRIAAELGLVLVMPDTSPRGEGVANDEGYDLGQGAGFILMPRRRPGLLTIGCMTTSATNCRCWCRNISTSAIASRSWVIQWAGMAH